MLEKRDSDSSATDPSSSSSGGSGGSQRRALLRNEEGHKTEMMENQPAPSSPKPSLAKNRQDSFEDDESRPRLRANYSSGKLTDMGSRQSSTVSFELSQAQQQQPTSNGHHANQTATNTSSSPSPVVNNNPLFRRISPLALGNRSMSLQQQNPVALGQPKGLVHHTKSVGAGAALTGLSGLTHLHAAAERKGSLSFSAVGFMVESMHRLHNKITDKTHDVEKAVMAEDVASLRSLCSQDESALCIATFAAVKDDRSELLESLIGICEESNLTGHESLFQDKDGDGLLHAAGRSGAFECCKLLLKQGFSPNRWNAGGSATPMHHVATDGNMELLEMLTLKGSGNIDAGIERDGLSVLHAAVKGNNVNMVEYLLGQKVNKMSKGKFTETPLHTASEHNFHECARLLLEDGILVDALRGEKKRETALHVAASNGYSETVSLLLTHSADPNARTVRQETPLHLAAKNLSPRVMRELVEHGSDVDACDCEGRPPLHFAINSNQKGSTECMQILIDKGANLDQRDNSGLTALHLAALNRKLSRVKLLIRNGADLCIKNNSGKSALSFVMKYVPNSLKTIEERMDAGIQIDPHQDNEVASKVKMNFNLLIPSRCQNSYMSEVGLFTEILQLHNNEPTRIEKILMHPLSLSFLHLKWQQVKWLYYVLILASHFIYSVTYSIYSVLLFNTLCKPSDWPDNELSFVQRLATDAVCDFDSEEKSWAVQPMIVSWIFLILFNIIYLAKETTKLAHLRWTYFREWESILNLLTIVSFPLISLHSDPFRRGGKEAPVTVAGWQFHSAGIGVFITWVLQLFLMGKVPKFGKYVQMLMNVGWSFFNFFVAYSSLLIGFALSFVILFPREVSFQEALTAPIKVMVMMTGEIEYNDLYYPQRQYISFNRSEDGSYTKGYIEEEDVAQNFPFTAHIVLAIFIIIVSIVIMNLLFGMAVSDVQELYKKSRLHQSIQQVHLISYMESILFSPMFFKMPICLQKFLRRKLLGLEGRYRNICEIEPDSYDDKKLLPLHLNKSIKDKCIELYRRRDDQPSLRGLTSSVSRLEQQMQTLTELLSKRLDLIEPAGSEPSTKQLSSQSLESNLSDLSLDLPDSVPSSPVKGSMIKRESQLSMASSVMSVSTLAKIPEDEDSSSSS